MPEWTIEIEAPARLRILQIIKTELTDVTEVEKAWYSGKGYTVVLENVVDSHTDMSEAAIVGHPQITSP